MHRVRIPEVTKLHSQHVQITVPNLMCIMKRVISVLNHRQYVEELRMALLRVPGGILVPTGHHSFHMHCIGAYARK